MGQPAADKKKSPVTASSGYRLSADQRAIAHKPADARIVVQAGPGTGKTEVVAHRIIHLLSEGLRPAQILVLSFSRSAVRTLTARIERMQRTPAKHAEELRYLSVRTFDSWTFRMLRQLTHLPGELLRNSHDDNIDTLIRALRGSQRAAATELLGNLRHIIVDEFQDVSGVRGALVLELLGLLAPPRWPGIGFTVLGDPAQAIYGFALRNGHSDYTALTSGALILEIGKAYREEVRTLSLDRNYRTAGQLGSLAERLRQILLRRQTSESNKLKTLRKELASVPVTPAGLKPDSLFPGAKKLYTTAVLTATNGEAIRVAQKLLSHEPGPTLPVILHGASQPRFVPPWIGATLGLLKTSILTRSQFRSIYQHCYPTDNTERKVALNVPPENTAWQRLARACETGADATSIDISVLRSRLDWADLFPDDEESSGPGIRVMTIHQSKGMEFDAVAIMADSLADREPGSDAEHLEAANVLFVGMTRAAKQLARISPGQTFGPMYPNKSGARERWCSWHHGWVNLEMGCPGDIDPLGFVDRRIFTEDGSLAPESTVKESQAFLADHAATLRGSKVMLRKWKVPGSTPSMEAKPHFQYRIHLQNGREAGPVLGVMSEALTRDLLSLIYPKGYRLPSTILNLRITEVVTMGLAGEAPASLAQSYARSGLWLGVNMYGSGDFQPYK